MLIQDCFESTGRAMGDVISSIISRGRLIFISVVLLIVNVVLTGVLMDQAGSRAKELEINNFTLCRIRTITSMLEPVAQNISDLASMAPCYYNKKHPGEVVLGAAPEISPVAITFCVLLWALIAVFAMALGYGRD